MGRREIETTTKRVVQTCDLCGRDLGGISPHRCDVCGRDAGFCCSALRLACDPRQPGRIDLGFRVCRDCEEAGRDVLDASFIDRIRSRVVACEHAVGQLLGQWQEWAKERREKGVAND